MMKPCNKTTKPVEKPKLIRGETYQFVGNGRNHNRIFLAANTLIAGHLKLILIDIENGVCWNYAGGFGKSEPLFHKVNVCYKIE